MGRHVRLKALRLFVSSFRASRECSHFLYFSCWCVIFLSQKNKYGSIYGTFEHHVSFITSHSLNSGLCQRVVWLQARDTKHGKHVVSSPGLNRQFPSIQALKYQIYILSIEDVKAHVCCHGDSYFPALHSLSASSLRCQGNLT